MASTVNPQKITLYNVRVPERGNQVIEDIETFLAQNLPAGKLDAEVLNRIERPSLDMEIKVKMPDYYAITDNAPTIQLGYRYAKISSTVRWQTGSSTYITDYYYFIRKIERISNSVAKLTLRLDVLNTYFRLAKEYPGQGSARPQPHIWGAISGASQIKRRHKDRYLKSSNQTTTSYAINIDRFKEGFNPYLIINEDPQIFTVPQVGTEKAWKMVFFTPNGMVQPYPIFFPVDGYVWFYWQQKYNSDGKVATRDVHENLTEYSQINISDSKIFKVFDLPCLPFEFIEDSHAVQINNILIFEDFSDFDLMPTGNYQNADSESKKYNLSFEGPLKVSADQLPISEQKYGIGLAVMPQCAADYSDDNPKLYPTGNNLREAFTRTIADNIDLIDLHKRIDSSGLSDGRVLKDPKLSYGEFSHYSLVLDSDEITINLDEFEFDPEKAFPSASLRLNFVVSLQWTGQCYYEVVDSNPSVYAFTLTRLPNPFANILQISRSNEDPQGNSEYLNYMRTGYNYDQKSRNLSLLQGMVNTGVNIGGTIGASLVGNVFGTVGGIVGTAQSLSGTAFNAIQSQMEIDRRKAEASAKGSSVSGLNANDLFRKYNGGRLPRLFHYKTPDYIEDMVDNYFYFYGYADNTLLSQYGNFNDFRNDELMSRAWFNYVEMEIVWNPSVNFTLPDEDILEEVKNKFAQGVTFFHYHAMSSSTVDDWDFDRKRENYERWLLE